MRVALIFNKTRPDTTGVYYERACQALGVPCDHWWLRDAQQIPATYDLYIRIDHGDDYLTPLPTRLRPVVFCVFDTHLRHSWRKISRTALWYDIVFCCHRDAAQRLIGAEWLPVACDAQLHAGSAGAPVCDVAFVGTDGGVPRKFYLQALRERYPNSVIGSADYRQMGSIYSKARIGFNYSIANDVNMRIFEILSAGTLLVTNALPSDDLQQLGLEGRRHLVLYRSPGELFQLIDYYLAHPDEGRLIAEAGAHVVRARHTYTQRLQQLLDTVSRRLGVH